MKTLKIDNNEYNLPESWSELTPKQFERVCSVRGQHINDASETALNASRMVLFYILSGVKMSIVSKITAHQWVDILPHMNFVFEVPDLKDNPMPIVKRFWSRTNLSGPVGMLKNSSAAEMVDADTAFVNGSNNKDVDKLYLLFAILWRPIRTDLEEFKKTEEWNGDIREPFNQQLARERAAKYKKLIPEHIIFGAWIYYWSFRTHTLMAKFKKMFPKNNKSSPSKYGWAGTLLEISGDKFGTFSETTRTNWYTILVELEREMEKDEKRREALEK